MRSRLRMKFLQLIIIILISLIVSTFAGNFHLKYCPSGQFVQLDNLSCVERDLDDNQSRLVGSISDNGNENWPACGDDVELSFLIVENSTEMSPSSCVDLTESQQLVMVYCDNGATETASDRKSLQVYPVSRCCQFETQYDYASRSCVAAFNHSTSPLKYDDSSAAALVYESFHLPKCASNEPLVEYHSKTHKIQFEKGLLSVNDRLVDGLFCIEDTTSGDVVAKVCESPDFCTRIPCIRKCCNERQFFDTTPEEKPKCENYDFDLMKVPFHNFAMGDDLLADRPLSMEISGKLKKIDRKQQKVARADLLEN
jgi:hypothetical protein